MNLWGRKMIVAKPERVGGPMYVDSKGGTINETVNRAFGGKLPEIAVIHILKDDDTYTSTEEPSRNAPQIICKSDGETVTILGWLPGGLLNRAIVQFARGKKKIVPGNLRAPETLVDFIRPEGEPLLWMPMAKARLSLA
jgi:hypothetical protein